MFEYIDRTSYLVCKGVFIVLATLLSAVVIVCISRLRQRRPGVWSSGFPKFLVMIVSCVLQIVKAALVDWLGVHFLRLKETEHEFRPSCETLQFMELTYFMLSTTVVLLVAAVVLLEALPRLRYVTLTLRGQMVVAVVLVVVSVLYGFVVVIPVYYFTRLDDSSQPCPEGDNYLALSNDVTVIPYVEYVVPQFAIYGSCAVLLLALLTTRKVAGRPGVAVTAPDGPPNQAPSNTSVMPAQNSQRSFPFYVLLAAAGTFLFGFMWFFFNVVDLWDLGMTSNLYIHLWAVSTLLSAFLSVFLPCCWLLDGNVRAAGWCCGRQSPMHVSRSQPGLQDSAASPAQTGHAGQRQGKDVVYTAVCTV